MTFTYSIADLSSNGSRVRLLLRDTDSDNVLFQDEEIAAFLAIEGDSIKRAAAMGLETIAANQVLVLKVIRLMDLQTDGAAVGRELRMQAKQLREQAAAEEASADGGAWDVAEMVVDEFTARERLWKQRLISD